MSIENRKFLKEDKFDIFSFVFHDSYQVQLFYSIGRFFDLIWVKFPGQQDE